MCVCDPSYPLRVHLQAPFRHGKLTPMMEEYNAEMSSVRVTVKWLFGNIINDFKFLEFKKNLKIGMSSVGKMYLISLCTPSQCNNLLIWKQHLRDVWAKLSFLRGLLLINQMH